MGVLWRVHLNWPLVIGKWAVPVLAHAGCIRVTQGYGLTDAIQWIKQLQANIREIGIRHHDRPIPVADSVPGVEGGDTPFDTGFCVDAANTVRPVNKRQFLRSGNPHLVGDPFTRLALVKAAVIRAIAVDHPHPICERASVVQQIGVVRAEHHVRNGIAPQNYLTVTAHRIDYHQTGFMT